MSENGTATVQTVDTSKYMYQIRKLKDALATTSQERDAARQERDSLKGEVGQLKEKGDSSALLKRNQELESKLRVIDHRKVLDRAAAAKGIKPEALDAFYKLSEYDAKGEPNEDEIGAFVDSKVEALSFLVGKAETTEQATTTKKVAGSGKGSASAGNGAFELPPDGDPRWSDPKWLARTEEQRIVIAQEAESRGINSYTLGTGHRQ